MIPARPSIRVIRGQGTPVQRGAARVQPTKQPQLGAVVSAAVAACLRERSRLAPTIIASIVASRLRAGRDLVSTALSGGHAATVAYSRANARSGSRTASRGTDGAGASPSRHPGTVDPRPGATPGRRPTTTSGDSLMGVIPAGATTRSRDAARGNATPNQASSSTEPQAARVMPPPNTTRPAAPTPMTTVPTDQVGMRGPAIRPVPPQRTERPVEVMAPTSVSAEDTVLPSMEPAEALDRSLRSSTLPLRPAGYQTVSPGVTLSPITTGQPAELTGLWTAPPLTGQPTHGTAPFQALTPGSSAHVSYTPLIAAHPGAPPWENATDPAATIRPEDANTYVASLELVMADTAARVAVLKEDLARSTPADAEVPPGASEFIAAGVLQVGNRATTAAKLSLQML